MAFECILRLYGQRFSGLCQFYFTYDGERKEKGVGERERGGGGGGRKRERERERELSQVFHPMMLQKAFFFLFL